MVKIMHHLTLGEGGLRFILLTQGSQPGANQLLNKDYQELTIYCYVFILVSLATKKFKRKAQVFNHLLKIHFNQHI
jgi:hypothetical protein